MAEPTETHFIRCTSPKGEPFIGTCALCGKTGLSFADADEPCENPRGLSTSEAVQEAITDDPVGTEEGDLCRRDGCCGRIEIALAGDGTCICGAVPAPCPPCENSYLHCPECGYEDHPDDGQP